MKKSIWLSKYKHPTKGIVYELGRVRKSEELYILDKEKKDFVSIGHTKLISHIRLPKLMTLNQSGEYLKKIETR